MGETVAVETELGHKVHLWLWQVRKSFEDQCQKLLNVRSFKPEKHVTGSFDRAKWSPLSFCFSPFLIGEQNCLLLMSILPHPHIVCQTFLLVLVPLFSLCCDLLVCKSKSRAPSSRVSSRLSTFLLFDNYLIFNGVYIYIYIHCL